MLLRQATTPHNPAHSSQTHNQTTSPKTVYLALQEIDTILLNVDEIPHQAMCNNTLQLKLTTH